MLALAYVPGERRAAIEALWRVDRALGAVVAGRREPMLAQIKLAWWRDSLEALDDGPAPPEPTLQVAAAEILSRGVRGAELAALEEGWALLLGADPLTASELDSYALSRGGTLFRLGARLLGGRATAEHEQGGLAWALVDLARHSGPVDAAAALERAASMPPTSWPVVLRPLGMLASLAARDAERGLDRLEAQGAPARMLRMMRHRLTGR